jgi:hypothetical protein
VQDECTPNGGAAIAVGNGQCTQLTTGTLGDWSFTTPGGGCNGGGGNCTCTLVCNYVCP